MSEFHQQSSVEVMEKLGVTNQGLSDYDVQKKQEVYGYNELEEGKRTSTFAVFLGQFKDLLVIILLIAAFISFLLGEVESTIVIMFVVILNAILGTVQHVKAEKSLDSLKDLTSPNAKVMRDNRIVEISSEDIVVGDLLYLDAGDYISADGRLVASHNLHINESSLTGESLAVEKNAARIQENHITIGDKKKHGFHRQFCHQWTWYRHCYSNWNGNRNRENRKSTKYGKREKNTATSESRSFWRKISFRDYDDLFSNFHN